MFTAGLDVGRKRDRSVLTFLDGPELHHIVKLEGTPFEEQADVIAYATGVNEAAIYADNTGMGVAMVDLLRSRGAHVVPVDITSGRLIVHADGSVSVGHERLFSLVRTFIYGPQFCIAPTCPYVSDLKDELKNLIGTFTGGGKLHVGARSGHDDFAFSFALAVLNFTLRTLGKGYGNGAQAV